MNEFAKQKADASPDQLELLIWLETASVPQICGALLFAEGTVRSEIVDAVRALMNSDRPGLVMFFPEFLPDRITLTELADLDEQLRDDLQALKASKNSVGYGFPQRARGYGKVLASLSRLLNAGQIGRAQHLLLKNEVNDIINKESNE
ncbi:hypothetical protein [Pseudomonas syringae]|uniref:Uncharacterized protein n=1 Tax=Pseudomonas syringae pv. actinidiae TaxID=103796 RepID=A0A2P0QFH3_PSESF|nr:hypothetical protein [Pseudomonas syringae]APQ06960.1 hypothetical protein PsaNZ47_29910 [Pseudomonas syringae pv. actinidiae]ARO44937.1 hypothetical protein [Pseudomonas syringae pv. actinidiae]ARO45040.1 hypothetical protein [Pseudomonas syringae pv. actinidiae]ARO45133.1 hypothetical protein [Pseudomonas syringae pv. actinidiae]MDU8389139.1 hypothetical protein [Pseudomonas syringae pv. actinidiae]